jgi:signal peptidase II
LILAGALGNILDSTFYGIIFSESTWYDKAVLFPETGGYSSVFHGKVVDMLYFPILRGQFPEWLPIWGGEEFLFFRPVFNIADSAITIGVIWILMFQKRYFKEEVVEQEDPNSEVSEA